MADNINCTVTKFYPIGGTPNNGYKIGFLDAETKAAQDDTLTVTNASTIKWCAIEEDGTLGTDEEYSVSGNVITLTSDNTGTISGIIVYQ